MHWTEDNVTLRIYALLRLNFNTIIRQVGTTSNNCKDAEE